MLNEEPTISEMEKMRILLGAYKAMNLRLFTALREVTLYASEGKRRIPRALIDKMNEALKCSK
jgi:hypothetical protein